ncbi:MAG: type VI secretion system baseplate subunit TssF [Desulfobacterales bacterium]|nr:MAG: type VI secretion system baseplate subunit TssF [Desulfobacterales bacterium]
MNPQLLKYYNRELQYIREIGGEFAEEFPKIAGRLGLDAFECADPYVERLLEGFAFLAARVQLKVDAEFPRFTQHLLEMVYPHYLAPLPSMAIVQLRPDLNEASLQKGVVIPRGTALRSQIGKGEQTACEYCTAHEVTLWPLQLIQAEYLASAGAVANLGVSGRPGLKAGLRVRLRSTAGLQFNHLALDRLAFFLRGGEVAVQVYEQLMANVLDCVMQSGRRPVPWNVSIGASAIRRLGFDEDQALLPFTARSFQGYRFLQEYFAFPERFLFVELTGLQSAIRRCEDTELDLIFLFDRSNRQLADTVGPSHFNLFCTPAINLFPKRADRIHLTPKTSDYHIVPDRTRPMDFEVYRVNEVLGFGARAEPEIEFLPFYRVRDRYTYQRREAYYTLYRELRRLSAKQQRYGPRSSYVGSEAYISLVDAKEAPYGSDLKQLGLKLLCTNRDLPLHMPVGVGNTDFTLQTGAPVESVRCLAGPTKPRPSNAQKETAWELLSHLTLNYLSLVDNDREQGAAALRQLLALYGDTSEANIRKQIEGVLSIRSEPVVRRIDTAGPITFGRGLELTVNFDESAFEGSGVILLGAVLEQFLVRYVSINAFTETVIRTTDRDEIMRWPAQIGRRHTI